MQQATDPAGDHMPRHLACAQSVAVASLRPMIAHSHALIGEAEKEPPFIGRHRVLISEWRPALSALEALITKVAALESLLEGMPSTQYTNRHHSGATAVCLYCACTGWCWSYSCTSHNCHTMWFVTVARNGLSCISGSCKTYI